MKREKSKTGLHSVRTIGPSIIHLVYDTQTDLAKAFCRIQEHYESPKFRGEVFTFGQFREWYTEQKGAFSYFTDWAGFNVPGEAFRLFFKGSFDPLTSAEMEILNIIRDKKEPFYVIGTYRGGDFSVYVHEVCHALYATNKLYRFNVDSILNHFWKELAPVRAEMVKLGYNEAVIRDEVHAYVSASTDWLINEKVPFPEAAHMLLLKERQRVIRRLRK